MPGTDKRRLPRHKRRFRVRFRSEEGTSRSAFTADVSRDGICVSCALPETPGRLVDLDVVVPGLGEVQLSGRVAWCRKVPRQLQAVQRGGFGVEVRLSPWEWASYVEALELSRAGEQA